MEDNEMAKRIKERRAELGLTLEQVAQEVGVGKSTVRKWETGMIANMRRDKIAFLASALHTTPAYLMGWTEDFRDYGTDDYTSEIPTEQWKQLLKLYDGDVSSAYNAWLSSQQAASSPEDTIDPEVREVAGTLNKHGTREWVSYGRYLSENEAYRATEPTQFSKIVPLFGQSFAAGVAEPESDFGGMWAEYETDDRRADFAIKVNGDSMEPYLPDGSVAVGRKKLPENGEVGAFMLDGSFVVKQFCRDNFGNIYLLSLNRNREDADIPLLSSGDHNLQCIGTILIPPVPLP